jgi:hypothetical protein
MMEPIDTMAACMLLEALHNFLKKFCYLRSHNSPTDYALVGRNRLKLINIRSVLPTNIP